MIEPHPLPLSPVTQNGAVDRMAAMRERCNVGPKITWKNVEKKQVAQECVRLFRDVAKFTAKHFHKAQLVLPVERHKKQFSPDIIASLRRLIAEVPLPPDPNEDTSAVHNGGYDTTVPGALVGSEDLAPALHHQQAITLPKPIISEPSDVTERIVAVLVDINLKSLALKGFTARQIEEAVSNRIDAARIRNLTVQANNSLTYFEEITRLANR